MLSNIALVSGPSMGAAQIIIWSYSCMPLPPMSTVIRTSTFCFVGALNVLLYIPKTKSLSGLSCRFNVQFVQLWEAFWSSSLATLPLGFNRGFISTFACTLFTEVRSWGCPGRFGFAPVSARSEGGAATWVSGDQTSPCTQGSWWLG